MEAVDIIGWVVYGLLFFGLVRLGIGRREPRGLERLNYRR